MISGEPLICMHQTMCTRTFIVILFEIFKNWREKTNCKMDKLWNVHLIKYRQQRKRGTIANYTSQGLILQTHVESKKQDIKEKLQNDFTYIKFIANSTNL